MSPDFDRTAEDYRAFRRPMPQKLIDRLAAMRIGAASRPPQLILDIAAGTGLLARALQRSGCRVVPLDPGMALARAAAMPDYVVGTAEQLPFADGTFDAVTVANAWHWLDRHRTPRQIARVLKPAGRVAVVYQTYIPMPGSVAEATEKLILQFSPNWRHANSTGINGQALRDLQAAGFGDIESFSFDMVEPFTRDQWAGYIRTTSSVGASMSPQTLAEFDREHIGLLKRFAEPIRIPHRIFAAVATAPALHYDSGSP